MSADALLARLEEIKAGGEAAVKPAAEAMGAVGDQAIKKKLGLSSHAPGTKTPSTPGMPPSLITGSLRRSVRKTRSYQSGAHEWTVHIAPTIVYARIQELGGRTGRGHRTHLPPRPYVAPALVESAEKARKAAIRVFRGLTGL